MPSPVLTAVPLTGDVDSALAGLPSGPGVGQVVGPEGRILLTGRASSLRRWAAGHLGRGRPPRVGRPRTDLTPVARELRFARTTSAFHQRLSYERLLALQHAGTLRRDPKPPAYLHLDPAERFPRLSVRGGDAADHLYGPFRNRRAAESARDALHRLFPLRPCDFVFEPDPALPLGLRCVYAQVRSCSAPCLLRIADEDYQRLAREVAGFLARPSVRPAEASSWIRPFVGRVLGGRALVAEPGRQGVELYPVRDAAVLEEAAVTAGQGEIEGALARLRWDASSDGRDDASWLSAWLHGRRKGAFLRLEDGAPEELAGRVQEALGGGSAPIER